MPFVPEIGAPPTIETRPAQEPSPRLPSDLAQAALRRPRPTPHLRPDREPPLKAQAARARGRTLGDAFARLSGAAQQDIANAQDYRDALQRGLDEAAQRHEDELDELDDDALRAQGFW